MPTPDMTVSWLPRPRTTGAYPQNLLRPSMAGCTDCTSQSYAQTIDPDTRRNFAGVASMIGMHGMGRLSGIEDISPGLRTAMYVLSALSAGASAFHGYRRNRGSIGWALGWGFLGGLFPIVTPAIAFAQGFGKPARR